MRGYERDGMGRNKESKAMQRDEDVTGAENEKNAGFSYSSDLYFRKLPLKVLNF